MKRILFILAITTGLFACNSKDAGSPSAATPVAALDGMFNAIKNGDFDGMKKFIARADLANLEEMEKIGNGLDSSFVKEAKETMINQFKEKVKNVSYKFTNEKTNGDNATVDAEITESGKTETHTFDLVKENGDWKIALGKSDNGMFNSMKGNMGPGKPDMGNAIEKFRNLPPDSQKMLLEKGKAFFDTLKARKGNL